jgi:2,3-diphosphopglycerate-independent phosphoglycerate mutase
LGLFGYDPLKYVIGRGVLEATGVGFAVGPNDVAIRCNFCTLDSEGRIADRRAGRIASDQSGPLAVKLRNVTIPGVEVFVEPVKEHRFVVVFRAEGLGGNVADTDPQKTGVPPLAPEGLDPHSQRTADVAMEFVAQAQEILAGHPKANGLTMRGFSVKPNIPSYREVYGLTAAAIAVYPMYKGLAQLVGMEILGKSATLDEEVEVLRQNWENKQQKFDFFFLHFKYTDSRGEDGNFAAKVEMIEQFDEIIPQVEELDPAVLIVTGDHSTPAAMASRAHAAGRQDLPAGRLPDLRRDRRARRRPGSLRGQVPDGLGLGPRRAVGEVRSVRSGEWRVARGEQRGASGEGRVGSGEWRAGSDEWGGGGFGMAFSLAGAGLCMRFRHWNPECVGLFAPFSPHYPREPRFLSLAIFSKLWSRSNGSFPKSWGRFILNGVIVKAWTGSSLK